MENVIGGKRKLNVSSKIVRAFAQGGKKTIDAR